VAQAEKAEEAKTAEAEKAKVEAEKEAEAVEKAKTAQTEKDLQTKAEQKDLREFQTKLIDALKNLAPSAKPKLNLNTPKNTYNA